MDDIQSRVRPQGSICSDGTVDDNFASEARGHRSRRICLIGSLAKNRDIVEVANSFGVPVVSSEDGSQFTKDDTFCTLYVLESFEGDVYNCLSKQKQLLLGPPALRQLANKKQPLPDNTRPLYNLSMSGVVVCFTGFRDKNELGPLVLLVHHMGGSIRKTMSEKVTHLISNTCTGYKYHYATVFKVPAMSHQWVHKSWERRHDMNFSATQDFFIAEHKLKPFHGAKVCFVGFPEDEEKHMTDILLANGGTVCSTDDPECTHMVMERASEVYTLEAASAPLSPTETLSLQSLPLSITSPNYPSFASQKTLETVHEKPRDHVDEDAPDTPFSEKVRKRKSSALLEQAEEEEKLRRKKIPSGKCQSEKKRKLSGIFKAPLNYFAQQRRRSVDNASFRDTLSQSTMSSSGVFSIDTVENLNNSTLPYPSNEDSCFLTPQSVKTSSRRKSLFSRTFSSSKFSREKVKKRGLNSTRLAFDDASDEENRELLNSSCFPDIQSSINSSSTNNNSELRSDCSKDARGPSVPAISVVDESTVSERPDTTSRVHIVKAAWFWTSVQKEICLEEKDYTFNDYVEQTFSPSTRRDSHSATPSSTSRYGKRQRLQDTLRFLAQQQSPGLHNKSEQGSGSILDYTASPEKVLVDGAEQAIETPRKGLSCRHQIFLELLQTESNYVHILYTILNEFKKHLEDMPDGDALLNNTELNLIFGKIPAIHQTHVEMLADLKKLAQNWTEDNSIGSVIVKHSRNLLKAYPPFINYFEKMKEVLSQCDRDKPRFHAFLKARQTMPQCGRQSLQELMIRPVQRLGSICLLLANLLKNTPKTNPDHTELDRALSQIKSGMDSINEDKRKAEAQVTLFSIFNEIENCPPDILCSHRQFIERADVTLLSNTEGLSSKGSSLILFVFSDQVEVCKKKSKGHNNAKSPQGAPGSLQRPSFKQYKHVKLIPLNTIRKVVDIRETDQCQKVFSFVCCTNDEVKERVYSFAMAEDCIDKVTFLKTLTTQMANNTCTPADTFLVHLEPQQLDIETSDVSSNGTLSKMILKNVATKAIVRAFSFNKNTPSKLKRAVSSMMSPFGSSNNLTPASELSQMRLASYNHINELGGAENASESPPIAPMSVQPTRKMKASSLNLNALKR